MPNETGALRLPYKPIRGVLSPVIPVRLFHNHAQTLELAYVDSGAMYSIFAPTVAAELGIDLKTGQRASISSVEGRVMLVFLHPVGIRIGDFQFRAQIGFSDYLGIGFNLLGRFSVFNQLQFCFNDRDGELIVSRLYSI